MSNHTVLALSGSLRADSHNTALLRAAQKYSGGLDIEIYDGLREIPAYDIAFRSHERFDDAGNLVDETTIELLEDLLAVLTVKIERAKGQS